MSDSANSNGQASSKQEGKGQSPAELINSFLDWMSPAKTGAFYAIAISFSILFDIIYLRALDISIMAAPTSIADHIRSSVIWIPPVLVAAIATWITSSLWSRSHEGLLSDTYKAFIPFILPFIPFILLLLMVVLVPLAMWWWIWDVVNPYDFSSSEDTKTALDYLRAIAVQLTFWVWAIFIIIFCAFPIWRSKKPEKAMNLRRIESIFLSGFSLVMFMLFPLLTTHTSARLSGLGACAQDLSPKSSLTIDNKEFVLFRSFGNYFLISSCEEGHIDFKFLSAEKVDSIRIHERTLSIPKQNEQDQNATKQPEKPGANSPTQPAASQPPLPSARQP